MPGRRSSLSHQQLGQACLSTGPLPTQCRKLLQRSPLSSSTGGPQLPHPPSHSWMSWAATTCCRSTCQAWQWVCPAQLGRLPSGDCLRSRASAAQSRALGHCRDRCLTLDQHMRNITTWHETSLTETPDEHEKCAGGDKHKPKFCWGASPLDDKYLADVLHQTRCCAC